MIRISHILKEFLRNLYRNPATAFGGVLSMALLLVLFDLFWIVAGTSDTFYDDLLSELKMEIFVAEGATDSTLVHTRSHIGRVDGVASLEYISKEDARSQLTALVGIDLLVGYDTVNPLPRSFIATFDRDYLTYEELTDIERKIQEVEGVSHIYYSKNWLEKAENTKRIISRMGFILGAVILLAVLISSANNMRLMTRARAVGFRQMRLQGAGGLFLSLPFLIEGLVIGGLSAAVGWAVILYWKDKVDFTQVEIIFPTLDQIIMFCAGAALLGAISAYLGIRRHLRL